MNALANSDPFWIALIFGLVGLYILPSVIAALRRVEGLGWIIVINLLPSGVGWLAALIAALALPRRTRSDLRNAHSQPRHVPTSTRTGDDGL